MNSLSAKFSVFSAVCAVLFCAPLFAAAHATGVSYQAVMQGYTVDIGYSSPAPQVGESVIFDFRLRDKNGDDVPFTDVWVRIESKSGSVFATGVYNGKFGGSRLAYVFPGEGQYTVYGRFENDADAIVEGSFPITVVPDTQGSPLWARAGSSLVILGGAVAGFLLALFLFHRGVLQRFTLEKKSSK